jgi:hypothetical protein
LLVFCLAATRARVFCPDPGVALHGAVALPRTDLFFLCPGRPPRRSGVFFFHAIAVAVAAAAEGRACRCFHRRPPHTPGPSSPCPRLPLSIVLTSVATSLACPTRLTAASGGQAASEKGAQQRRRLRRSRVQKEKKGKKNPPPPLPHHPIVPSNAPLPTPLAPSRRPRTQSPSTMHPVCTWRTTFSLECPAFCQCASPLARVSRGPGPS